MQGPNFGRAIVAGIAAWVAFVVFPYVLPSLGIVPANEDDLASTIKSLVRITWPR